MKLATCRDGSRDGLLMVVSRDLASAHYASGIATRLQQVLDDWNFLSPQLQALSQALNHGKARHAFPFDPARCMAPLPRAYQRVDGAAFASDDADAQGDIALVQRAGDDLFGPRDALVCADIADADADAADGIGFGAGLAVITGDVDPGCHADAAIDAIRLAMLVNDWHGRGTTFGPVAVTPDELGTAWRDGRVHLSLDCALNGERIGRADTGAAMRRHFGTLISGLARRRPVGAGSIVGSGAAVTGAAHVGDKVRIDMHGLDGDSVFGAIEQRVERSTGPTGAAMRR